MKTVIMAGGFGSRISELFPNIPKPLIPIENSKGIMKPVLEWEIDSLREQGFKDIILTVSYMAEKIIQYFGDGSRFGVSIEYFVEEHPLGTAGALFKIKDKLGKDDFLLLNADAVFDVDFNRMVNWHRIHNAAVTIFTHPNSHPYDSGIIVTDKNGTVRHWYTKEEQRPDYYKNRVNAGLHIMNPSVLSDSGIDSVKVGTEDKLFKVDLDRDILRALCGSGRMFAYDSPEYVKDMGTPERYKSVCLDFKNGVVSAKNLKQRQKAIFLDRDGTINKYVGFLRKIDDFELLDGVSDAIRMINNSEYLCIVTTNQPVIARGEVSVPELCLIHNKMETLLGNEGSYIDGLYYCPHHPDKGYEGEIPELKISCNCRKPKPGMLLEASHNFNIDLSASWMIGDDKNDIKAGKAAGCMTILISSNNENNFDADYVVKDLKSAVNLIVSYIV